MHKQTYEYRPKNKLKIDNITDTLLAEILKIKKVNI